MQGGVLYMGKMSLWGGELSKDRFWPDGSALSQACSHLELFPPIVISSGDYQASPETILTELNGSRCAPTGSNGPGVKGRIRSEPALRQKYIITQLVAQVFVLLLVLQLEKIAVIAGM